MKILFTVLLPLFSGGMIYIFFRTNRLLMFRWFENIGLGKIINTVRESSGHGNLPGWIIYSLPDALWIFSFTSFMLIIWQHKFSAESIPWLFVAPAIGVFSEIGQAFHFLRGAFDMTDFILILIASILPFKNTVNKNNLKFKFNVIN